MKLSKQVRGALALAAMTVAAFVGAAGAEEPWGRVALPEELVSAASVFQTYTDHAAGVSARFSNGESVAQGVRTGVSYEYGQLEEGMIAYGAIAALQDQDFIGGVVRAGLADHDGLVQRLRADPTSVIDLQGSDAGARRVRAALQSRGDPLAEAGARVKQAAYEVQHQAWSKVFVNNPAGRLAEVKALSAHPTQSTSDDEARLIRALVETRDTPTPGGEATYTPVVVRSLALAAEAILGAAKAGDMPQLQPLLTEPRSADCLHMSKLNLYQCMAVAGPHYEDIFCLGQHALIDTGQCVAAAVTGPAVARRAPAPMDRTYLVPVGQRTLAPSY